MKNRYSLLVVLTLVCFSAALAISGCSKKPAKAPESVKPAAETEKAPAGKKVAPKISLNDLKTSSKFVLPSPIEVFNALGKLSNYADWGAYCKANEKYDYKPTLKVALNFGDRVAAAFICIEAKNKQQTQKIGGLVTTLGKALGIDKDLQSDGGKLGGFLAKEDWNGLRSTMDSMQYKVEDALIRMSDNDKASLVSIGGWISGLYYVSDIVAKMYTKDNSTILAQTGVVEQLLKKCDSMAPETKADPTVALIIKNLNAIKPLMDVPRGAPVPQENVVKLRGLAAETKKAIEK
jgi:hypothetical protein